MVICDFTSTNKQPICYVNNRQQTSYLLIVGIGPYTKLVPRNCPICFFFSDKKKNFVKEVEAMNQANKLSG